MKTGRERNLAAPARLGDAARRVGEALRDDRGAAAVSFILAFPIFLTIVGIIVQFALMVNAKIMVASAADAAARSAMTSLPDGAPQNVHAAAWMALAPLSPKAAGPTASEAEADFAALQALGVDAADSFPARYTYAMEATKVDWSPRPGADGFARSNGREVEVTVSYRFKLTVPGASRMVSGRTSTIAGVEGRFWEVTGRARVVTAHGRKARADEAGWPR